MLLAFSLETVINCLSYLYFSLKQPTKLRRKYFCLVLAANEQRLHVVAAASGLFSH